MNAERPTKDSTLPTKLAMGLKKTRVHKKVMASHGFSLSLAHTYMRSGKDIPQLSR